MALIKNVSPFGDLEVPSLGLSVLAGETIEVSDEVAEGFLSQPFHWAKGDSKKSTTNSAPTAEDN